MRIEPLGVELGVLDGESLMHAAERLGYRWPTVCHGEAACTVCYVDVSSHPDAFAPAASKELQGLTLFGGQPFYEGKDLRLACQARLITDTVVTKRGVRRQDI